MADIYIHQGNPDDATRFSSQYWVQTPVANDRYLVTISGIVIIDYKGITSDEWRRDRLHLGIKFPTDFFPKNKILKLEQWAPFITINAIYNKDESVNAGWAVDNFGLDDVTIGGYISIWADIAVRDSDGYLFRLGYNVTVSGYFADMPPGPA
ncbi:MAG TPA: hypothetical protein VFG19_00960 [Geobacteraceae bacterium]|nr:hypothetical protein [Geobacteraceae bacterium]